jgi:shikimate kinase
VTQPKPHVALVGLMGAGKSTIGRRLARELNLAFVDTDDLIIASTHRSIAAIFAKEGEAGFRAHEYDAVRRALECAPAVVALGGGAVTHAPTRELIAQSALRVYVMIEPEIVVARLKRARTLRPLLGEAPTLERVERLLQQREPYYRDADVIVSGTRRSPGGVAREIAERLRALGVGTADARTRAGTPPA